MGAARSHETPSGTAAGWAEAAADGERDVPGGDRQARRAAEDVVAGRCDRVPRAGGAQQTAHERSHGLAVRHAER